MLWITPTDLLGMLGQMDYRFTRHVVDNPYRFTRHVGTNGLPIYSACRTDLLGMFGELSTGDYRFTRHVSPSKVPIYSACSTDLLGMFGPQSTDLLGMSDPQSTDLLGMFGGKMTSWTQSAPAATDDDHQIFLKNQNKKDHQSKPQHAE